MNRITVVGDVVLDHDVSGDVERLCPDAPVPVVDARKETWRAGGAGLAAAVLADIGVAVTLVTAIGNDEAGERVRSLLDERKIAVVDLGTDGATGEKMRIRAADRSLLRLDRGSEPARIGDLDERAAAAFDAAEAILVADYGRGMTSGARLRRGLRARSARTPLVWDPHPRGTAPIRGASLVTPNDAEATGASGLSGSGIAWSTRRGIVLLDRWRVGSVAVTMGARGAVLARPGVGPFAVPAPFVATGDTSGAGDHLAGVATLALARGAIVPEALEAGVAAASAFVAGEASEASRNDRPGLRSAQQVRAAGGTIVATGGCFDLLHAGHIAMLQSARRLGDHLVVLLNSDASVRRLKGSGRPLQREQDRADVLRALGCVDEVIVFDDDTPVLALERLRPHVFVKGADYAVGDLPEAAAMADWGGQALTLPYLPGRSTTRLVEEANRAGN